jgi:hypothetical protein
MKETEFVYRIRQALNEGIERMDYRTIYRLEQARGRALAADRLKPIDERAPVPALQAAGAGAPVGDDEGLWTWMRRAGLVAPLFVLVVGFIGIYQWQRSQAIAQAADIDLAVLLDDNPIDTYADSGFGVLLKSQGSTMTGLRMEP